jgi:hypothetical protein
MYWNRSAAEIAAAWQAEIESRLETGATAILLGGTPDTMTSSAATLLAMENSIVQRNDIATPLLVAGGNSAVWLGLLLPPQPAGSDLTAPAPTLIYGGADEATYLAMVGLTSALAQQFLFAPSAAQSGSAAEMGVHFAPRLQPGAATAWEMLPFIEVGEQPTPALAVTTATVDPAGDPTGDWIASGVMLLALCLVLSSLLI